MPQRCGRGERGLRRRMTCAHGGDAACRVAHSEGNTRPGSKSRSLRRWVEALQFARLCGRKAQCASSVGRRGRGDFDQHERGGGANIGGPAMKLRRLALLGISTNLDDAIPAISELFLKLQRTLADRPPPDMDPVLAEQHRTIQVLRTLSDFVSRSCCNPALKNAIGRFLLDHALRIDHLSDGVRHLVLTEVTRPGRIARHLRCMACPTICMRIPRMLDPGSQMPPRASGQNCRV
jgi:hypothetical protein